jgi:hypothetical protein
MLSAFLFSRVLALGFSINSKFFLPFARGGRKTFTLGAWATLCCQVLCLVGGETTEHLNFNHFWDPFNASI